MRAALESRQSTLGFGPLSVDTSGGGGADCGTVRTQALARRFVAAGILQVHSPAAADTTPRRVWASLHGVECAPETRCVVRLTVCLRTCGMGYAERYTMVASDGRWLVWKYEVSEFFTVD
ncbi:MAG: hypothetical protein SFW08_14460 [Gemmatimonadaceae bacterium]|nr:hypothetical protein [Gemmatimonadaceae bacterium]